VACFPMLPFASRIRDGRFSFGDIEVTLPPNVAGELHPMHGHAWQVGWQVVEVGPTTAILEYEHTSDSWPWEYRARQVFTLHDMSLHVTAEITNTGLDVMPYGIGWHPFFPATPHASVRSQVKGMWALDTEVLPGTIVEVPKHLRMDSGLVLRESGLDHVFTDWSGEARVSWPEENAQMFVRADPSVFSNLTIYAPNDDDFFCVEPISNSVDGFNLLAQGEPDHGVRVLQPAQTHTASVWFEPQLEVT